MRNYLNAITLAALILFVANCLRADEPLPSTHPKQILFHVRVLQGDPNGSREQGTLKVLAAPTLVTGENRPAKMQVGGTTPVPGSAANESLFHGVTLEIKPERLHDGRIRAAIMLEISNVANPTDERVTKQSHSMYTVLNLDLGKVVTLAGLSNGNNKTSWVEILAEEVRLDSASSTSAQPHATPSTTLPNVHGEANRASNPAAATTQRIGARALFRRRVR